MANRKSYFAVCCVAILFSAFIISFAFAQPKEGASSRIQGAKLAEPMLKELQADPAALSAFVGITGVALPSSGPLTTKVQSEALDGLIYRSDGSLRANAGNPKKLIQGLKLASPLLKSLQADSAAIAALDRITGTRLPSSGPVKTTAQLDALLALIYKADGSIQVNADNTKKAVQGVKLASQMLTALQANSAETLKNMQEAYNGESNANARYLAFAKKADEEGYGKVASLFRAAARAEQIHYLRHAKIIKTLGGTPKATLETPVVKSTKDNVEEAFKGETYEKNVMYPKFLAQAKKAENKEAIDAFEDAQAAEGVHAELYKRVLSNLNAWKGKKMDFYVCPLCGNVVEKLPAAVCPICGTEAKKFLMVN